MKKRNSKKGMELSLNTIIIAVIVIVVLVAVVAFFLFGFKGLSDQIKIIFYGTTAGTNMVLAQQQCATYCQQAEMMPESTRKTSPYCTRKIMIDENNDGEADYDTVDGKKVYWNYKCHKLSDGSLTEDSGNHLRYLGVSCTVEVEGSTEDIPKYLESECPKTESKPAKPK